jgi:hypothetical protein
MSTWQILTSFPTAVPTVLLVILLIYWCLSLLGFLDLGDNIGGHHGHGHDFDSGHDVDAAHGHEVTDLHTLAGILVALGLGGVPFSIVATLLVFFSWLPTALVHQYLIAPLPAGPLHWLLGAVALVASLGLSIIVSARLIRPMRPLFVKHQAPGNHSLIGQRCSIVTLSVDEKFGRAEVATNGVSLNVRVWARTPNTLGKGATAIILAYDEANHQYEVQAEP